jgi:hypothetical protein
MYGEICEELVEFGLDEHPLEDTKALIDKYADELLEETAAEESE